MRKLTFLAAVGLLLLGSFCLQTALGQGASGPPEFAGIFGSRILDVPNPNDSGNSYTMVHHVNDAAGYDALTYDPLRGWGFEAIYSDPADQPYGARNGGGIFGPFDDSPNGRNTFDDTLPDELYDSFVGFKSFSTALSSGTPETPEIGDPPEGGVFRVDVPNGSYRFVGVFGEADNNHTHRIVVEDGGSGPPEGIGENYVVLVNNHDQAQYVGPAGDGGGSFARVGFDENLPPEPLGSTLPMFVNMDEFGLPTEAMPNSPILEVTEGYMRLHLLQGDSNAGPAGAGDANGGDIVLFEVYPVMRQTLIWNGLGDGIWGAIDGGTGESNWLDEAGSPVSIFPDVDTSADAVINANTVTVAADRQAISLTVGGGGVAIGGGNVLSLNGAATFADGTALTLDDGAVLDVDGRLTVGAGNAVTLGPDASLLASSGSVAAATTSGDATIGVAHGSMNLNSLSDGGTAGMLTKQGEGTLSLASVAAAETTFNIQDGTLSTGGAAPLGGSTSVILSGGRLLIEGEGLEPLTGPEDAVGRWTFDNVNGDAVIDEGLVAPAANGTLVNGAAIVEGKLGNAVSLDIDAAQYVDLGNPGKLDIGDSDFTISAWIKTSYTTDPSVIISKGGNWDSDLNPGIRTMFTVGEGATTGHIGLSLDDDATKVNTGGDTLVADDLWHHVVTQREGQSIRIYVDGMLDGSNDTLPDGYSLDTSAFNAYIGTIDDSRMDPPGPAPDRSFDGLIDEVAVYARALSADEIAGMAGTASLEMTATNITVTEDSTLETVRARGAAFGPLTLENGVLTTVGAPLGFSFAGTTISGAASAVGVNLQVPTELGLINVESPAVVLSKTGPVDLVLASANAGSGLQNATFEVQEGRLVGLNNSNPFGAAALSIRDAELVLAAEEGATDVTYDNALTVSGLGTLTVGSGGVGATSPVAVTLGSETNGVAVNSGTLFVETTDGYTLNVAGSVTGAGAVQVLGGSVTLAGGADVAVLDITTGSLDLLADVNVASMQAIGGTLNTGGHQVTVSDRLRLGQTIITAGDTPFTASGANLADGSVSDNLVFSGGTITVGAPSTPTEGLLAQWTFDDPAAPGRDDSDNLRDLELEDADYESAGKLGGALSFDGAGRAIDDDAGDYLNGLAELTVAMWIKSDATGIDRGFWECVDSGNADAWGVRYDSAGANAGGSNVFKVGMTFDTSGGNTNVTADQQESSSDLQTTEWQHVAITWEDGEGFKMYVDGVLDEAPTSPMSTTDGVTDMIDYFVIGDGSKDYWQGLIDDVYSFEKALGENDIATLASGEFSTSVVELSNTNLTLVADTTVSLVSEEDAEFGNLVLDPGVTLTVDGAAASFNDVTAAAGSTIQSEALLVRGVLSTGGNPGTITVEGELELLADAGEGDAEYVADPAGDVLVVSEDIYLSGTLTLKAGSPMGDLAQGEWGESTHTIVQVSGDEAAIIDTFVNEPTPGEHLGHGVFHQEVVYGADETTVEVSVFQAAPGDVDGDRQIDNGDLQAILGAGSFNNPGEWSWPQGDFNGNGSVGNDDLQMILATGLFGGGVYAADAGAVVVPEPGTLMLLVGGLIGLFWLRRHRASS